MKKIFLILLIIFNISNCAEQSIDQEYCNDQFEPGQIITIKNSTDEIIGIEFNYYEMEEKPIRPGIIRYINGRDMNLPINGEYFFSWSINGKYMFEPNAEIIIELWKIPLKTSRDFFFLIRINKTDCTAVWPFYDRVHAGAQYYFINYSRSDSYIIIESS